MSAQSLWVPNESMSNVSTSKNNLLKGMDIGPIPLIQPTFDLSYFDLTDETQTVDEAQTVEVDKAQIDKTQIVDKAKSVSTGPRSASGTTHVTAKTITAQTVVQTTAQKYVNYVKAQKQCTYMDVAREMVTNMLWNLDPGPYIPVVISEVAPSSHVAIVRMPLQTLNMNSSAIDLTADTEPAVQLLPDDVFADSMSRTISNRKVVASRLFEVFEDNSGDEHEEDIAVNGQDELPDIIQNSRYVTTAVKTHSYVRGCQCHIDRQKSSGRKKIYWCSSLGKSPTVKCVYEVIYRIIKNGVSTY